MKFLLHFCHFLFYFPHILSLCDYSLLFFCSVYYAKRFCYGCVCALSYYFLWIFNKCKNNPIFLPFISKLNMQHWIVRNMLRWSLPRCRLSRSAEIGPKKGWGLRRMWRIGTHYAFKPFNMNAHLKDTRPEQVKVSRLALCVSLLY